MLSFLGSAVLIQESTPCRYSAFADLTYADPRAAMRILERAQKEGRKVTSFVSWCGGLPEPGASNVPLGYKFSWSPRAVLTAAQNDARYKLNDKVCYLFLCPVLILMIGARDPRCQSSEGAFPLCRSLEGSGT